MTAERPEPEKSDVSDIGGADDIVVVPPAELPLLDVYAAEALLKLVLRQARRSVPPEDVAGE
ncbi:hypothetical protein ACWEKT_15425 [Nocardia takedensis]